MASEQERIRARTRLATDFPFYARHALQIRTKEAKIVPFELNGVQRAIHKAVELQKKKTGRVRALILKARQPGCSTYVEGRYYHQATHRKGVRAFILTHKDEATDNLFNMVKRFHDHCPPAVKPQTRAANAKELDFGMLDSSYRVGTARAGGVGRSDTIQLFHGSEVAHWANAEDHAAGVLQAVPNVPGTEIILESTANGMGGLFHSMCMAALRGDGEYILIFVPWFDHHEYRTEPPDNWMAPGAFQEVGELFGLDNEQVYWAFEKNAELATANGLPTDEICWRFRQEYPATVEEAFHTSSEDSFVPSELVLRARKASLADDPYMPLTIGCDFARGHRDRNWFLSRRGRRVGYEVDERFHSEDTLDIAGRLARLIEDHKPAMCFLDTGGGGAQVYDILCGRGYEAVLTLVNFGSRAYDSRKYANRRAECYGNGIEWLSDPAGADLLDDDVLHGDICAAGYKHNASQQVVLEPKEKIRERLKHSPDGGDAWALNFAEPVVSDEVLDADGFYDSLVDHSRDRSEIGGY